MIYIITPHFEDFKRTCTDNRLPLRSADHNVMWVDRVQALFGRLITKNDKIILGSLYEDFPQEVRDRIQVELELRRRK